MKPLRAPIRFALGFTILALAACDTSGPADIGRDVLSAELSRAVAEVPAFGGLTFEAPTAAGYTGIVVYTLGDDAAAEADLRARIGGLFAEPDTLYIRARPARGNGSEALAAQVTREVSQPIRSEYDARTGYVRVGFWTQLAARQAFYQLESAGVPLTDVIIQVEDRQSSN